MTRCEKWAQALRIGFTVIAWAVVFAFLMYYNSKVMFEQGAIWGMKQCKPEMRTSQPMENPYQYSVARY